MAKRRAKLFAIAIGACRLNPGFTQTLDEAQGVFVFRRRDDADKLLAPGPIDFQISTHALLAGDPTQAHRQALRIATELFPETDGWVNHHAREREICEFHSFKKSWG